MHAFALRATATASDGLETRAGAAPGETRGVFRVASAFASGTFRLISGGSLAPAARTPPLPIMKVPGLRSPHDEVGGIVYFGRMLDKLRLKAAGRLPEGYHTGTKEWYDFDSRCTRFLKVRYGALKKRTLAGGTDEQILRWCFKEGRKPGAEEIEIWNTFMRKRGWQDASSEGLESEKRQVGLGARKDIVTWFDLFDAEEERAPRGPARRR
ncbi:MAG TPA: DUF5069 domain-containing protein [Opitutaceae bacterium]